MMVSLAASNLLNSLVGHDTNTATIPSASIVTVPVREAGVTPPLLTPIPCGQGPCTYAQTVMDWEVEEEVVEVKEEVQVMEEDDMLSTCSRMQFGS